MYEFAGIAVGLFLLAVASELGGPDPVVRTEFVSKPLIVLAVR